MPTLTVGIALFLIALGTHFCLWRLYVPKHQGRILATIFMAVPIVGSALSFLPVMSGVSNHLSPVELALVFLLYGSVCAVYFILFTAIEADSPTLTMIELIFRSRDNGISREDVLQQVESHSFSQLRLDQLLRDGMVVLDRERLLPTQKGRAVIDLILAYRRLLGRTQMGG